MTAAGAAESYARLVVRLRYAVIAAWIGIAVVATSVLPGLVEGGDDLGFVGLEGRGDEPVNTFSGGMRRRLELARVLVHQPEILVLDEPTEGLDPAFFRAFWHKIRELRDERGLSVLLTTHDPAEADQCDRLAILDSGRIVASGTPAELKARLGGDLVTIDAGSIRLTVDGLSLAESVVRRHRLAERFLTDLLGLSWAEAHVEAGEV